MKKISYVVAVYNTEKYLRRCLDSLAEQSYENIEVIIVNDGSTDNSPAICKEYADRHKNFVCVEKENGGLSDARNVGLRYVTGEYVVFVDSDDWCEISQSTTLAEKICNVSADIGVFGYYNDFSKEHITKEFSLDNACMRGQSLYFDNNKICDAIRLLESAGIFNTVWNKVYRTDFIKDNDILFDTDGMPGEDLLFNVDAFILAKSVCLCNELLYHYMFQDEITLSRKYRRDLYEKNMEFCAARKKLYSRYNLTSEEDIYNYAKTYVQYGFACIPNAFRKDAPRGLARRKEIFQKLSHNHEFHDSLKKVKNEDIQYRLLFYLMKFGPTITGLSYSMIMWFRNNLSWLYDKLRAKKYKEAKGFTADE